MNIWAVSPENEEDVVSMVGPLNVRNIIVIDIKEKRRPQIFKMKKKIVEDIVSLVSKTRGNCRWSFLNF